MDHILITTQRLIRIPCRVAQMAAHVPLLATAAVLAWIKREGVMCPVNF